ncbi:response regulator transcription factor [Occallatibacter riparius]|uniref:Response regulator n=1 Tax=Occallatibacter riparius TaxID=1002689 RepID=A0A9J7BHM6_9BACT|nr:response regulator [Occallatibacter riparius]UWZ82296.1 response regulator [Occallatibacter riparius]
MTDPGLQPLLQTVYLVEDDAAVREALCDLLESAGMRVERFASAEELLASLHADMPGCLVADVRLPGLSGMELQAKLAETGLTIPIIIMTAHGDIPMVRKALKAGAVEFLTKPFQDSELLQAIDQAFAVDRARRQAEGIMRSLAARYDSLSARERQVMELVTDGMMNKEIADEISLSIVTVKLYRKQVMEKMQADSLADLVKMRQKLESLEK